MPSTVSTARPTQVQHYQQECSRPITRGITTVVPDLCPPLEPPPYGQYYIYSNGPKTARPHYKGTGKRRGGHDYHSMMWDPHIYRGPTYKSYRTLEKERCERKAADDAAEANRMRKKYLQDKILACPLPPVQTNKSGFADVAIQTDPFLEEITDEVIEKDDCTQTDKAFEIPVLRLFRPTKLGIDVETQVLPWEMFSFDEGVRPIVTTVVGKIIEQSLIEIMEEDELETLLVQQRAFEERRRIELLRLRRMQLREQKVTEEREHLIAQRQIEVEDEKETEGIVMASFYAENYLGGVAYNSMDELRRFGFMTGNDNLNKRFLPWLHSHSIREVGIREKSALFLDEIIQAVVDTREAEVAEGIWREINNAEGEEDNAKRMSLNDSDNFEDYYYYEGGDE